MALSAAAAVDCWGTPALEAALPATPDERLAAGADDVPTMAPVPLGTSAVELTPGTMGTTREVGTMGTAVGLAGGVTAGTETAGTETPGAETEGTTDGTTEGTTATLVAGGAWI